MLKILQNNKVIDGLMVAGFGLLAIGIAMSFQAKKTEKTEIKIEPRVKGEMVIEPTNVKSKPTGIKVGGPSYAPQELRKGETKVNINQADVTEVDKLNEVGPAIGQRIIDYRKGNNGFMNIEEIKLVKGIGDKMYEKIKDQIEI